MVILLYLTIFIQKSIKGDKTFSHIGISGNAGQVIIKILIRKIKIYKNFPTILKHYDKMNPNINKK